MRFAIFFVLMATVGICPAKTLRFSGYTWEVRDAERGGPGPNFWSADNAWVDANGRLHLKITASGGRWECAEIFTRERLGFGRYTFRVEGAIDRLDRNVVLGLFNYPTPDVGRDRTNEIDIEFAQWGRAANPHGNFTVWPVDIRGGPTTKAFRFRLEGTRSRHTWTWTPKRVKFRSRGRGGALGKWTFAGSGARIAQEPMPVHLNLWLFDGRPPADGREAEIVVSAFRFRPL